MGSRVVGTTVAKVLVDAGTPTRIWARRPSLAEAINTTHENPDYLPGSRCRRPLVAVSDVEETLRGADVVVLGVPVAVVARQPRGVAAIPDTRHDLHVAGQGVETSTVMRMSEVVADVTGAGPERIAVLSGPNLAKEVAVGQPPRR